MTTELAEIKARTDEILTLLRVNADCFLTEEEVSKIMQVSVSNLKPLGANRLA